MENLSIHRECTDTQQPPTPQLPITVISDILQRLPVKPLARFKCVSKAWYSLLHSRAFILRHVTRSLSTTTNHYFTRLGRSTIATLNLPTPNSSAPLSTTTVHLPFSTRAPDSDFIGSCHGVLCISNHPNFIALFSPTTRTHRVIPVRVPKQGPESHWVDYGFGYDSANDDYKVVRVDQHNGPSAGSRAREIRVYSLKESRFKWRKAEVDFPGFLALPKGHGKFLNKSLQWIATKNPPNVYDLKTSNKLGLQKDVNFYKYVIVAFDLTTEKVSEIELPFSKAWLKKAVFPKPKLVILGEKLAVQIEYGEIDKRCVEVWIMKEYGVKKSWTFVFNFFPYALFQGVNSGRVIPMAIFEDGSEMEVLMERNAIPNVVYFWYNVKTGRIKDVVVDGDLPSLFEWRGGFICDYGAVVYVESLVSLNNAGLVHAAPPENPAVDVTDHINSSVLPFRSALRAHSYEANCPSTEPGRMNVPLVGYGKRLP